ncbi:MAG: hypothetical protein ACRD3B_20595, partial [Candidatus Sulfotelmatobacter sp.]
MKFPVAACAVLLISQLTHAQQKPQPKSVTLPAILDHNRVIIEVDVPARNGPAKRVRAWIDTGDPELLMSVNLAKSTALQLDCEGQTCTAAPPKQIVIGDMPISLEGIKEAKVPVGSIAVGLDADINIPSTVLR